MTEYINDSSDEDDYYLSFSDSSDDDGGGGNGQVHLYDVEKSRLLRQMFNTVYKYYCKHLNIQVELQAFLKSKRDTVQSELDKVASEIQRAERKKARFANICQNIRVYLDAAPVLHVLETDLRDIYMEGGLILSRDEFRKAIQLNQYCYLHVKCFCSCILSCCCI